MTLKNILLILVIALPLYGCSILQDISFVDTQEKSPLGVRGLIFQNNQYMLNSNDELCVFVDEMELWERDDYWNSIEDIPLPTIQLDSNIVLDFTIDRPNSITTIMDDDGNVIGEHGLGFTVCPVSLNLSEGIHNLVTSISSTSGNLYSLNIDFVVINDD